MQHLAASSATAEESRWIKCPSCDAFVYHKRLERNLRVCPECNYHFRLPARERLAQLLDEGSFSDLSGEIESIDALDFTDSKPYAARLIEARAKTGNADAALYGTGKIEGLPLVVAIQDFSFMGGSMGGAVGEVIARAAELALSMRVPLLVITASGGARMQEGCVSLMQMVKTSQAIGRLHEQGILYISLLTDPTTGGVSASFATLGDLQIAEPKSLIGFTGQSIIEQTIRQKLPEGFQRAEFLMDHGMLDLVEPRENLRHLLHKILAFHKPQPVDELSVGRGSALVTDPTILPTRTAWDVVALARNIERPNTLEYIGFMFDDFQELHGDRLFHEDAAIVGGLARLGELTVMVLGHQKGHSTGEMVERNFGMANPEGYRKALRLMRYAAKFHMPVITLVDTPGAFPGIGAEERGQSNALAQTIMEMSRLPVPIVTVITGEGNSGGAIALAAADRVLQMENAYYSVISPEGCSVILFKSAAAAPRAAEALHLTAPDLLRLRVIDGIVPEPEGGAHTDPATAAENLKTAICASLNELRGLSGEELLERRYQRFRAFGAPGQQTVLAKAGGKA
ncbi:MAG: acetyl-CoA carboxylase carboxyltransferase subunit alpha [Dehalococcoidia bacterium]